MIKNVLIDNSTTFKGLFDKYGDKQLDKCLEEMDELKQEIVLLQYGQPNADNMLTEIADVIITLSELIYFMGYSNKMIEDEIEFKISRTKERENLKEK